MAPLKRDKPASKRKEREGERRCVVDRAARPRHALIRFVRGPDGALVPDIGERLPGRGVWVTGTRDYLERAREKRLFARGLKSDVAVPSDIAHLVDRLLADRAKAALSMANKAGAITLGFEKVKSSLGREDTAALFHASDAARDGRSRLDRIAASPASDVIEILPDVFNGSELSLALGQENVVHGILTRGGVASAAMNAVRRLAIFRGALPIEAEDGPGIAAKTAG
ncbi:MAG: RNA-binding protein [Pseudomonadota bacterium]